MNLDLNVFSSSNGTRYVTDAVDGGGFKIIAFSSGFNINSSVSDDNDAFETDGTFDTNTFSSTSTTRYEFSEQEVGAFDYTLDFTFE